MSAEATVVRNYLEWLFSIPWNNKLESEIIELAEEESPAREELLGAQLGLLGKATLGRVDCERHLARGALQPRPIATRTLFAARPAQRAGALDGRGPRLPQSPADLDPPPTLPLSTQCTISHQNLTLLFLFEPRLCPVVVKWSCILDQSSF